MTVAKIKSPGGLSLASRAAESAATLKGNPRVCGRLTSERSGRLPRPHTRLAVVTSRRP
jgi:hypothetical protein